jgi:hypothetical protein
MRLFPSLFAVTATAALSTFASGQTLLTSFEDLNVGDPAAVGTPSGGGPVGVIVDSGPAVTEGSQAVLATNLTGSYDKVASIQLTGLAVPSDDITAFQVDWLYDWISNSGGTYSNLSVALGGDFPFTQLATSGGNGQELNSDAGDGLVVAAYTLSTTQTAALSAALTAGTNVQLEFFANKDDRVIIDLGVDNVVFDGSIVPEPATAALLGLGGLTMLRRRKA